MKQLIKLFTLITLISLQSCNDNESINPENDLSPKSLSPSEFLENTEDKHHNCSFATTTEFGPNTYWANTIVSSYWTNRLRYHHNNSSSTFRQGNVGLYLVGGPVSANAISYNGYREVHWGEDFLRQATRYGDAAVAFIAAHEIGHQAQVGGIPSRRFGTVTELQADTFGGYYLRRKVTTSSVDANSAANFAYSIGENIVRTHGSRGQRRAAMRIGWYLGKFELSVVDIDKYFFIYYEQFIRPGVYNNYEGKSYGKKKQLKGLDKEIHDHIYPHIEEIRDLYHGKTSEKELL